MLESSLEERVGTQSQVPKIVVSLYPVIPSVVVRDIDSLSSFVLTDLGAILEIGPPGQADSEAVVSSLQSLLVEGPTREVNLKSETIANTRLGSDLVVEVGSSSISEDSHEVTGRIPTTLETSTPLAAGGNALPTVRGEYARDAASSFVGLEAIV